MAIKKSWLGLTAASLALFIASCGNEETYVKGKSEVKDVDASDLVISNPEKSVSPAPKIILTDEAKGGYEPESILGISTPLFASGNEPFWTAEIDKGWIVFERPGLPLVEVPVPEFTETGDKLALVSDGLHVELEKGGCDGEAGPLKIVLKFGAVETKDGTEDIEYFGCAGPASEIKSFGTNSLSWKEMIEPSLTAIDACLAQAGSDKLIVALYPREPGTVGMILGDKLGGYEECGADTQSGEVYFLDPMSGDQARDWMTGAAFVRKGQPLSCKAGDMLDSGAGEYLPNGC